MVGRLMCLPRACELTQGKASRLISSYAATPCLLPAFQETIIGENTTQHLSVEALPDYEPTVSRWLWSCEETRRQTRDTLTSLEQPVLD
jgi:O-glycosyl hydrolase